MMRLNLAKKAISKILVLMVLNLYKPGVLFMGDRIVPDVTPEFHLGLLCLLT